MGEKRLSPRRLADSRCFFFFQAEDGIRDLTVTGVQTCALPICSFAVGVVSKAAPDRLIAAKHGAGSVVVGLGKGEMFIASDIPAILSHTRDVVILEDGEVAVVTSGGVVLSTLDDQPVQREPVRIMWEPIMAEKGGYRHFMLKEIYEQPRAITDTFRGRI